MHQGRIVQWQRLRTQFIPVALCGSFYVLLQLWRLTPKRLTLLVFIFHQRGYLQNLHVIVCLFAHNLARRTTMMSMARICREALNNFGDREGFGAENLEATYRMA